MRAVILAGDGSPQLTELPLPDGPGAVVHVRACGLCGSDVEKLGVDGVIGHELEGILDDGARVTVLHRVACGECERCRAGHESTCVEFGDVRIAPGGFAEMLRATHVVPLPEPVREGDGIWVEPLACVLRAADRVPRGRVLVAGCGAVGQLWVQTLLARGDDVYVVEPRRDRLDAALALGASVLDDDADAAVLTAPAALRDALAALAPGGTLLAFAASGAVEIDLDHVYRRELTLLGSRSATPAAFAAAIDLLPSLRLPEVVRLPLERFDDGVAMYRRGDALKVVFVP